MLVFNDREYLRIALDSLLSQSYQDFELIISDDNSTDGSDAICQEYQLKDPRVKYIRQEKNLGISKNMEFLLKNARGKYFMWAANDDRWHEDFILILKNILDENINCVSAFCAYNQVDENNNVVKGSEFLIEDYSGNSKFERLEKLIIQGSDGFGYGLFRRNEIINVQFPTWWWINRGCAYNNIFPTLCYYLTKGEYQIYKDQVLWNNRIKSPANIHHKIPFSNNFILAYMAFALRKFNLVSFSIKSIIKAEKGIKTAILIFPRMFFSWFIIPVFLMPGGKYIEFKSNPSVFI